MGLRRGVRLGRYRVDTTTTTVITRVGWEVRDGGAGWDALGVVVVNNKACLVISLYT